MYTLPTRIVIVLYTMILGAVPDGSPPPLQGPDYYTADLHTNIADFRGFDSSIILIVRGVIPRSIGDFPDSFSEAMLVGIMLVGRGDC